MATVDIQIPNEEVTSPTPSTNKPKGGRNLLVLGIGAIIITTLTTGISLWVYRSTGDIYLDRSRPGFLPDEDEVDKNTKVNTSFTYSDTGPLDAAGLEEYLKELRIINDRLRVLSDPYAPTPLSDESLGIKPISEPEEGKTEKTEPPRR